MIKPDGWQERLAALVEERRAMPFAWGGNDCCSFALAAVERMTRQPMLQLVTWESAFQAQTLVEAHGISGLATLWLGGPPVENWRTARRGDVVLIDASRGLSGNDALAVCLGAVVACPGEFTLQLSPLKSVRAVWAIG